MIKRDEAAGGNACGLRALRELVQQGFGVCLVLRFVFFDAFGGGVCVGAHDRQRQIGFDHKTVDGRAQLFGQRDAAVHGAV